MSLFPAYANPDDNSQPEIIQLQVNDTREPWLINTSFPEVDLSQLTPVPSIVDNSVVSALPETSSRDQLKKKKHKKEKSKKHHRKDKSSRLSEGESTHNFTGNEDYYIDKDPAIGYRNVDTLHRPACPRYKVRLPHLGITRPWKTVAYKRYYEKDKHNRISNSKVTLSDEEFTMKTKAFKERLARSPHDLSIWLEYVQHQHVFPMSTTKAQLCERKLDVLRQGLQANPGNEKLYREYVRIVDETYPSYEVSKILDALITKDPTNYILWNALILATQGSMARCNVPDVLKLYARCMQSLYKRNRSDEIMLKLFKSSCLFLRQSGLYEQFFALLKLALDLNVSENKFNKIQPSEGEHDILIEYEEVILKSGLPMNEIWLRIEKLRQNFYFLPCPADRTCSDPQRIIFTEDIFHYVYPLSNREHSFHLTILILQLLKVPLTGLNDEQHWPSEMVSREDLGYSAEFDSIEEILPIFLKTTINQPVPLFDMVLIEMLKDFSVGPTYIPTAIGYELYLNCIIEIMLLCAESFESYATNARRNIILLLWLRLERVILMVHKLMGKWSADREKRLRTKIKNLMKRDENRNCVVLYNEYALIEYECGRLETMETVFMAAISNSTREEDLSAWWATYVNFVEVLMREKRLPQALSMLIALALGEVNVEQASTANSTESTSISPARALLAMKKLNDSLGNLVYIERNVSIMEIEQYLLPDHLICTIKAKIYFLMLWKEAKESAIDQIEYLIRTFVEKSVRHTFIREQLYELLVNVIQYLGDTDSAAVDGRHNTWLSGAHSFELMQRALDEFPSNLLIAKSLVLLESQPWHRIRTIITQKRSPKIIPLLIAGAIYRCKKYTINLDARNDERTSVSQYVLASDVRDIHSVYKIRICNLLRHMTSKDSPLCKNSLIWRMYLKCLLDFGEDFDKSKNILFAALDECPWNKALYLDGTVFVPQELAHIQDLIIEKQLRIYALPEELEILRNYEPTEAMTL